MSEQELENATLDNLKSEALFRRYQEADPSLPKRHRCVEILPALYQINTQLSLSCFASRQFWLDCR